MPLGDTPDTALSTWFDALSSLCIIFCITKYIHLTAEDGLKSYSWSVQRIYSRLPLGQQEILLQLPGIQHRDSRNQAASDGTVTGSGKTTFSYTFMGDFGFSQTVLMKIIVSYTPHSIILKKTGMFRI